MAAAATTAAAAIGSSFSTAIPSLKVGPTRMLRVASLSHALGFESISVSASSHWRSQWLPRMTAALAQEEAAVMAPVQEEQVEEEKEKTDEGEEVVAEAKEVENSSPPPPVNTKLYFGNLPYSCDSAQLAGIVQDYGSPELVEVLYDRDTGRSRGFAFVTMSSVEDGNAVIENLDGREFGGRTMRVNFADKPKPKEPLYPETEFKLFVGNLAWSVTSEILTAAFQEHGDIVGARVLYDGETGRSRGYGFVCYATKSEMDSALEALNGVEVEGRPMRVSLAQGKKQ